MITRRYRDLDAAERNRLSRGANAWRFRVGDIFGVLTLTALLYVGGGWCLGKLVNWLVFSGLLGTQGSWFLPALGAILGMPLWSWSVVSSFIDQRRAFRRMQAELKAALNDGRAEVISCNVYGAVELAEVEDEGPGFFLDVGHGVTLFVQGQHLMELDPFPASSVTITRVVATKEEIDVRSEGTKVAPSRMLDPVAIGRVIPSGQFFRANLPNIENIVPQLQDSKFDCLDSVVSPSN